MENKKIGYLLLGISIVIIFIIYLFNSALTDIVNTSCTMAGHGDTCPMFNTVDKQTNLSLSIVALIIILAIFLIFSKPQKEIIVKKVKEKSKPKRINKNGLRKEDLSVLNLVEREKGIFQADIIERTGFGKAKVSRILDRLENKNIIERKRRGMTNIVILKE